MKKNKNNNISKTVTFDEAMEDPAYADFHEAILLLKDTPRKDILKKFLPKEYEMFVIEVAMRKMSDFFDKDPNIPLKKALASVIKNLPKDISDDLLVKVVNQVFAEWAELVASAQQNNAIATPPPAFSKKKDLVAA